MTGYIRPDSHYKIILFVVILTVFLGNGLTLFVPEMACAQSYQSYSMASMDYFYDDWLNSSNNQWWSMPYGQSTLYFQTPDSWGSYSGWMQQPLFDALGSGYTDWGSLRISPVSSLPFYHVGYPWAGGGYNEESDEGYTSYPVSYNPYNLIPIGNVPYGNPALPSGTGYWNVMTRGNQIIGMGSSLSPGGPFYRDWLMRQIHGGMSYVDPFTGDFVDVSVDDGQHYKTNR